MENAMQNVQFERPVLVDGQQKYIDVYLPETRVMIEQKGMTKDLTKPEPQSGGIMLTPYQQAKRYANNMPLDEMPRYIVTCNFQEFRIHDQNKPGQEPEVIMDDSDTDSWNMDGGETVDESTMEQFDENAVWDDLMPVTDD